MQITTNNQPRPLIGWADLTPSQKEDHDWLDTPAKQEEALFFHYKNGAYLLSEAMVTDSGGDFKEWHGAYPETYFSGVLVRVSHDCDEVIIGRYFS